MFLLRSLKHLPRSYKVLPFESMGPPTFKLIGIMLKPLVEYEEYDAAYLDHIMK